MLGPGCSAVTDGSLPISSQLSVLGSQFRIRAYFGRTSPEPLRSYRQQWPETRSVVPMALCHMTGPAPSAEALGYWQMSLRDRHFGHEHRMHRENSLQGSCRCQMEWGPSLALRMTVWKTRRNGGWLCPSFAWAGPVATQSRLWLEWCCSSTEPLSSARAQFRSSNRLRQKKIRFRPNVQFAPPNLSY